MACASLQVLQMLVLVVAPLDQSNPGAQIYHFVGGFMELDAKTECEPSCLFLPLIATGDACGFVVTGIRCEAVQTDEQAADDIEVLLQEPEAG